MHAEFDGEMRKLSAFLQNRGEAVFASSDGASQSSSLVEAVKQAASKYCSRQEAIGSLNHVASAILRHRFDGVIAELYTVHASESEGEPPDAAAIGLWLDNLQGQHGYFAAPRRATERRARYVTGKPQPAPPPGMQASSSRQLDYVDVDQDVVRGFTITVDVPLNYLLVRLTPRYASVTPAECYVVALLSRAHLRLFWGFSKFRYLDWERTERVGPVEWASEQVLLRDLPALGLAAHRVCQSFADFVEGQLRAEYGVPTVTANAAE